MAYITPMLWLVLLGFIAISIVALVFAVLGYVQSTKRTQGASGVGGQPGAVGQPGNKGCQGQQLWSRVIREDELRVQYDPDIVRYFSARASGYYFDNSNVGSMILTGSMVMHQVLEGNSRLYIDIPHHNISENHNWTIQQSRYVVERSSLTGQGIIENMTLTVMDPSQTPMSDTGLWTTRVQIEFIVGPNDFSAQEMHWETVLSLVHQPKLCTPEPLCPPCHTPGPYLVTIEPELVPPPDVFTGRSNLKRSGYVDNRQNKKVRFDAMSELDHNMATMSLN